MAKIIERPSYLIAFEVEYDVPENLKVEETLGGCRVILSKENLITLDVAAERGLIGKRIMRQITKLV